MEIPFLKTDRTSLTLLQVQDALLMQLYYVENWRYLKPWEPKRNDDHFSLQGWQKILLRYNQSFKQGRTANFAALNLAQNEVIGVANFSSIVHGPAKFCNLGYSIAEKYQGQGLMYEILQKLIPYMMESYDLHRIHANHMPHNERSAKLLKRLGFEKEGYARDFLQIDGKWQDHVLNAYIRPNHD